MTNPVCEWMFLFVLVLSAQVSVGFYMPGAKQIYDTGDPLYAKVSSWTSTNSLIPMSYYSLPYCKPPWGVEKSEGNLGEILMGDRLVNSPYRFRGNVNESVYICTTDPLTEHGPDLLKKMTRDRYKVNFFFDTLPVIMYESQPGVSIPWLGVPVGYYWSPNNEDNYYVINHLKFRVLIREHEPVATGTTFEIVGFEVQPCSIEHDPKLTEKAPVYCDSGIVGGQVIKEGERLSFSFEVEFVKSDIRWSSRWDSLLKMGGSDEIHRYSTINSVITSLFLMGVTAWIFVRNTRGRAGYQAVDLSDKEAQQTKPNDASEGPKLRKLLCVMVGIGSQIMATAIVTVTFAAIGFISPASRGALPLGIIIFYLFHGLLGGFVGIYLLKTMNGSSEAWKSTSWYVALGFPGIVFAIHSVLNLILWHHNSTAAIPVFAYVEIFSLWLGILVPITLIGGYLGSQTRQVKCPVHVEMVSRTAGARKFLVWLLALGAGILPFGTISLGLFSILSSVYLRMYYQFYGFLLIALLMLIIVGILASVIVTITSLRAEDSGWLWKAFWASGSTAIYVFLYCINYLVYDLQSLRETYSVIIYLGYSIIVALATMLAAGSVGLLGSFFLVKLLTVSSSREMIALRRS